ncbi:MAG: AAA family ATPase [bacterium]|nr:AAA family ATPase [bacterium]
MHLRTLELNGFKSFGKKTELSFGAPITAIVGPNGSGKSNVAESFRFCLGEQSVKSMRGKKTEDLIWNGAGSDAKGNRASVRLVFDNLPQNIDGKSKKLFNVDFDEVTVERTVFRDGVSEYKVNGSPVRLKDVIELLSQAHIGASGHHIISQGEADRILNANSRDRREMVEDALGLKIYQYKRKESEKKLQKTEENTRQVESLRREIAPHIRFLKKQVEKIEKAKEMRAELATLYSDYLKREYIYIQETNKRLSVEEKEPQAEKIRLEEELGVAKETLEKAKKKDGKSEEVIKLEKDLSEIRNKKDYLISSIGRVEGEIAGLERVLVRQKSRTPTEGNVPLSEVRRIADQTEEIEESVKNESDPESIKEVLRKIKEILRSFIERHSVKKGENEEDSEREIAKLKEDRARFQDEFAKVSAKEKELQRFYSDLKESIDKEKDQNRDAEKAVFRIMAELNSLRSKLSAIRAEKERIKMVEDDFNREIQEGVVLVGRDIKRYETANVSHDGKTVLSEAEIISEDRNKQEDRRRAIEKIKIRLEDAGLVGAEEIVKEHDETVERDMYLEKELLDLKASASSLKELIRELGEKLDTEFKEGVQRINQEFQKFFQVMFGGGNAVLSVVKEEKRNRGESEYILAETDDSEIVAAMEEEEEGKEGIDINVSLPRKKIKGLMMLSGGERALTSIALIFAMSQVNPPPFLILDETDAALDEANSKKYGDMIENLSQKSQLILITHNRETMSRAGIIYGVTMDRTGVSKLLSIQFAEAVAVAK